MRSKFVHPQDKEWPDLRPLCTAQLWRLFSRNSTCCRRSHQGDTWAERSESSPIPAQPPERENKPQNVPVNPAGPILRCSMFSLSLQHHDHIKFMSCDTFEAILRASVTAVRKIKGRGLEEVALFMGSEMGQRCFVCCLAQAFGATNKGWRWQRSSQRALLNTKPFIVRAFVRCHTVDEKKPVFLQAELRFSLRILPTVTLMSLLPEERKS